MAHEVRTLARLRTSYPHSRGELVDNFFSTCVTFARANHLALSRMVAQKNRVDFAKGAR